MQLDQTPAKENNENNEKHHPFVMMESQDAKAQSRTDNFLREIRMMGETIDKMSTRIEEPTQEVKDQEARQKCNQGIV